MRIIYEDNHIIVANKLPGEIVQADKTGDRTLADDVKEYIKRKYGKPGDVFLGIVHRLDRPVGGLVMFARTSKALVRLNEMLRDGKIRKTYWAITKERPFEPEDTLVHWILRDERKNVSHAHASERRGAKKAVLHYRMIGGTDNHTLLEVEITTGRHHQIRCQLARIGCPIRGDLKYGAPRSNPDGSISLLARGLDFTHPVSREQVSLKAPIPDDNLWRAIAGGLD